MSVIEPVAPSASATGANAQADQATRDRLDAVIAELASAEDSWGRTSVGERAELLDAVHGAVAAASADWATTASRIKGLDPAAQAVGEEWISGPYPVLASTTTLAHAMRSLAKGESPLAGKRFGSAPGGRVTIPVLPGNAYEAILLHGFTA